MFDVKLDMKYTVIIPHYNSYELLQRLLSSIPVRNDIQVVVVDDHSEQFCSEWIDCLATNVTFYQLSTKGYAGGARNLGLSVAEGRYILFADSDDMFTDDSFDVFDESIKSGSDLILFKSTSFVEGSCAVGVRDKYRNRRLLKGPVEAALGAVSPWAKLIRKTLLDEHGVYFSEVPAANDVVFSIKLACVASKIEVVQRVVYKVSQGEHSLSSDFGLDKALSRLREQRKRILLVKRYKPIPIFKYCLLHSMLISFMVNSERLKSGVYDEEFLAYRRELGSLIVGIMKVSYFIYKNIFIRLGYREVF